MLLGLALGSAAGALLGLPSVTLLPAIGLSAMALSAARWSIRGQRRLSLSVGRMYTVAAALGFGFILTGIEHYALQQDRLKVEARADAAVGAIVLALEDENANCAARVRAINTFVPGSVFGAQLGTVLVRRAQADGCLDPSQASQGRARFIAYARAMEADRQWLHLPWNETTADAN